MSLIDDLEILAHELECDPTYNFKGLMTSDGDKFTDKLARVRAGIARVAELEAVALNALYHHQGAGSPVGQPIRRALGIGQFDRLTDAQIAIAHSVSGMAQA